MVSKFAIAFAQWCKMTTWIALEQWGKNQINKWTNKTSQLNNNNDKNSALHWPTCRKALEKPLQNMYAYSSAELNPLLLNSSQLFGEAKEKKIHHFGTPLAEEASVSTFLTGFSFLAKLIFNGGWEASMTNICLPIHKQACELRLWTLPSEKSDSKMVGEADIMCWKRSDNKADREA